MSPGLNLKVRRRLVPMAIIAGAALLGYLTSMLMYPAPLVARDTRVALVIGLPVDDAERELEAQGFRVRQAAAQEEDPTLPAGYVTWQEPPAYVEMPEGSEVELTVSEGPATVTVPDVVSFETEDARRVLSAAGFAIGTVDSVAATAEPGVVVATRPSPGTPRQPGTAVDLVLSRGPAAIRVPDLSGMSEADARLVLEDAGLRVGAVRRQAARGVTQGVGRVVEQRPRAGVMSPRGGRVDLTVRLERNR